MPRGSYTVFDWFVRLLIAAALCIVIGLGAISEKGIVAREPAWGATFSPSHASYLGMEWMEVYRALSDDLGVERFRVVVNWNWVEPEKNTYDLQWLDQLLAFAESRNQRIVLVVGQKVPRWPECHFPEWVKSLPDSEREEAALEMVRILVERYRWSPAVAAWQLENEPFFPFGVCPRMSKEFLKKETSLVRSLDPERPLIRTDSGELGDWIRAARAGDVLGVSVYRATWNQRFGYFFYPLTSDFYRRRARMVVPRYAKGIFVSELQVEPWAPHGIMEMEDAEQMQAMPLSRVQENLAYARATGFPEAYVWGVEWWYWRKLQGDDRFWEEGRTLFVK